MFVHTLREFLQNRLDLLTHSKGLKKRKNNKKKKMNKTPKWTVKKPNMPKVTSIVMPYSWHITFYYSKTKKAPPFSPKTLNANLTIKSNQTSPQKRHSIKYQTKSSLKRD